MPLPSAAFSPRLRGRRTASDSSFQDNHLNLWSIDVATGKATKIDTDTTPIPADRSTQVWSPDSRWIAYSKNLDSHLRAIFVYSMADGKATQVTDGMSDAISPAFDAGGKYLYFLASTNFGPQTGWLEMSSIDRPTRRSVYLAVLSASEPSPFLPETGDEPGVVQRRGALAPDTGAAVMRIDFAGIGQRILAIGVPAGGLQRISTAGPAGTIFYSEPMGEGAAAASRRLIKYRSRSAPPRHSSRAFAHTRSPATGKSSFTRRPDARWGVVGTDRPGTRR